MSPRKREQENADQNAETWVLGWLARREHSVREARQRLTRKGVSESRITEVMDKLIAEGAISDRRFAESLVRVRAARGKGPLLVGAELRSRGIERELAREITDTYAWHDVGKIAKAKRFGEGLPADSDEFDRQARFLAGRGFPIDMIFSLLGR
ncbi:MAG: regulatory protein RecX [Gammaproteobacteria bacterium]|nr:regulatory protein RecX [Gammaproteobacteria bacterium]MCY4200101.1 regulatory protein RecX [Gammaproteobacteria bacterium]MCY4278024.1 regulatory protein RecX [Gammaproteobacteria bacterium]MCY4322169.1 regulatory protein RecX [Gammaproteobacteria bacterium]